MVGEMNKILSLLVVGLVMSVSYADAADRGRVSMSGKMMAAPRVTMSRAQISNMAAATNANAAVTQEQMVPAVKVDTREKERNACLANNIGVGNTFVWASRFSNVSNYAAMTEDVEQPENNVCFVKVGLKSDDERINLSDIPEQYFPMGQMITCGSWANEDDMRQRILDAKKKARVLGTVGGVVGGAGIGVGAMELFGNKLIGGKVEGQKALEGDQLMRSQVLALQKDNVSQYNNFITHLKTLKKECTKDIWKNTTDDDVETICDKYDGLFDLAG